MRDEAPARKRCAALARDVLPFAILAVVAALGLLPVFSHATIGTANVYNVLQTFADYGLLALAVGLTMILARVRPLDGVDVRPRRDGGGAAGRRLAGVGILAALAVGAARRPRSRVDHRGLRMSSVPVTLGGFIVLLGITYVISHDNDVPYDSITVGLRLD